MRWKRSRVIPTGVAVLGLAAAAGVGVVTNAGVGAAPVARPARGAAAPLASAASAGSALASPVSGVGLTTPTKGSGARIKGGTVTVAEVPGTPPVYISPMYSSEFCGNDNNDMLSEMLFQPLYTYGNNYKPTVSYQASIGRQPKVSNGGRTYTIKLNHYRWSDGEPVTARDLVFWMNVLDANPAGEWCGTVAGLFPYNVKSYRAVNRSTFQITFKRSYNPTWVLYDELSQLTPMPLAWDRTSLSQPAPTKDNGHLPDTTKKGAAAVYALLNAQGKDPSAWANSPLWKVVDGPYRLTGMTANSKVTMVANKAYTGAPKPTIQTVIEEPFSSDTAEFNEVKSGGANALTIAALPPQDEPQAASMGSLGYDVNKAAIYAFGYFNLNLNNPTLGPIFRQLYFRQALQHAVDQQGWIKGILKGTAIPSYSPIPIAPSSPLISGVSGQNPYPFSMSAARKLLVSNGWKVVPNGASYCAKPGTGKGECGAGIKAHEQVQFTLDYVSGSVPVQTEMQNLQSNLKQIGVQMGLAERAFATIQGEMVMCTPKQPPCKWQAAQTGFGWSYSPDYYPTGETLFRSGSVENSSNYNDREMNKLINETLTAPPSKERAVMTQFANYAEKQLPVVYQPISIGTFGPSGGTLVSKKLGGYTANAIGIMQPQYWYLTK